MMSGQDHMHTSEQPLAGVAPACIRRYWTANGSPMSGCMGESRRMAHSFSSCSEMLGSPGCARCPN